ncbi:hypothetical protein [Pedobacter deserti]|uniref:hypothetical protein n=1 Tax=Pedobacter deserti TaxID=2817382 RepID=UPI002108E77F|nr:hypothetical protein [Pedobacter sp. SYSU D00382]
MIAVKLTVEQLVAALKGLNEREKAQVKQALAQDQDAVLREPDLAERYKNAAKDALLFEKGQLKTYSLSEILDELCGQIV